MMIETIKKQFSLDLIPKKAESLRNRIAKEGPIQEKRNVQKD